MLLAAIFLMIVLGITGSCAFSKNDGLLFSAIWIVLGIALYMGIPAVIEVQSRFQNAIAQ